MRKKPRREAARLSTSITVDVDATTDFGESIEFDHGQLGIQLDIDHVKLLVRLGKAIREN